MTGTRIQDASQCHPDVDCYDVAGRWLRSTVKAIPYFMQAKVSLDRIETFLNEPEVDDEISSLKKESSTGNASSTEDAAPLGLKKASFRWNSADSAKSKEPNGKKRASSESETASTTSTDLEAVRFELRDLSVTFPQGKLTVVTGPTASGKTALIVRALDNFSNLSNANLACSTWRN